MKTTKRDKRTNIEKEFDIVAEGLQHIEIGSDEYKARLEILERLDNLEARKTKSKVIFTVLGPIIIAGAGILQTVLILKHEELNIITSKALGFVLRGRV